MRRHGFTIVELLIVIVVIAILATLGIIVLNGLNQRARTASLTTDLANAARQMKLARADTSVYPSTLPSSTKTSPGNVLQLAATSDPSSFCINGYGPEGLVYSRTSGAELQPYTCDGALIGSAVGGTTPSVQLGVDIAPPLSLWSHSGGTSYNTSNNTIQLSASSSGTATTPLIRVDGAYTCQLQFESYATTPSVSYDPHSRTYIGTNYFGSDGVTPAMGRSGHTGNGNAQHLPLNTWTSFTWGAPCGSDVKYMRVRIHSSPSSYTSNNQYRNFKVILLE